jgi:hypothetical protein
VTAYNALNSKATHWFISGFKGLARIQNLHNIYDVILYVLRALRGQVLFRPSSPSTGAWRVLSVTQDSKL